MNDTIYTVNQYDITIGMSLSAYLPREVQSQRSIAKVAQIGQIENRRRSHLAVMCECAKWCCLLKHMGGFVV